ncbi:MAG TPA: alpha-L-arabinofuranosidase C-terminal domain-containing protein, partial [Chthonomonadales bacterium]|nr:alpha-L-arabinofuranosidase C-terminal domain-containing protein [Chthonomonadales bacterium]
ETGRWYRVRIELHGTFIKCYLDGKLITRAVDTPDTGPDPLYVSAGITQRSRQIILRVVNVSAAPQSLRIRLEGVKQLSSTGDLQQMSGSPEEVNSVDAPTRVAPEHSKISGIAPDFTRVFPAHSVSVIRLRGG